MIDFHRRAFIRSAGLISLSPLLNSFARADLQWDGHAAKNITLGVIVSADDPETSLQVPRDLGFSDVQLNVKTYSPELARRLSKTLSDYHLTPVTLICMGPGNYAWNLKDGPSTIGLIPREGRPERIERLRQGVDFCKAAGIPAVHAHFGFIPENPRDELYTEFIEIMKKIADHAVQQGINIYFETGQETPVTLLRAIEDIGTNNLFVNYDLANVILYGKSNALDGLKILSKYVRSFHAKDGLYPTDPNGLGKEVPIPKGEVNFPAVIAYLKQINFSGNITIEYELGDSSKDYILSTKKYLEKLLAGR